MIQAAIHPETGELLGLLIPIEDLTGSYMTVFGTAEAWARLVAGEAVDPREAGVIFTPRPIELVPVDNLSPPGGLSS
jgi:hypothetical protein